MAILCGIDFETSGLNPEVDKIIEVGFCLWDTAVNAPLEMKSYLVSQSITLSDEIIKLTGITQGMIDDGYGGRYESEVIKDLDSYHDITDYWVSHNVPFEAGFFQFLFKNAVGPIPRLSPIINWIDTMTDLPNGAGNKKLTYAAAEHGILNPFAHRALPDVLVMMQMLSKYDFAEVEKHANAQTIRLQISFPYDADKVLAVKALGGWVFDSALKCWGKNCKDFQAVQEIEKAAAAGFTAHVVN